MAGSSVMEESSSGREGRSRRFMRRSTALGDLEVSVRWSAALGDLK